MSNWYESEKNISDYARMSAGTDGRRLVALLLQRLTEKSTLLEIGMGLGRDALLLHRHFEVTASDSSGLLVERFKRQHNLPEAIILDAVSLEIDRKFDCLYSNKVLQHLTRKQLSSSFLKQARILNEGGTALHTFWYGSGEDRTQGLLSCYHTEQSILELLPPELELAVAERYTEAEPEDSIYVLLQKNAASSNCYRSSGR